MYTRSYTDERHGILIPESYGGTALSDAPPLAAAGTEDNGKNPWEGQGVFTEDRRDDEESVETSANASKIHAPAFLSNILKNTNISLQKIGKEEILILGAAAFLFLSKEGDKQLALMILLLLFLG